MIYAIQAGACGPVKIGKTTNMSTRMNTLQTGNHERLRLLAVCYTAKHGEYEQDSDIEVESTLHSELASELIHGEWFRPTPKTMLATCWILAFQKAAIFAGGLPKRRVLDAVAEARVVSNRKARYGTR